MGVSLNALYFEIWIHNVGFVKKILLVVLFPFALTLNGYAQIDSLKLNSTYFKHYYTDARDMVISPIKWKGRDWAKFGVIAGTTTALFFLDEPIQDYIQDNYNKNIGKFTHNFLDPLGSRYSIGFAASFYFGGLAFNNPKAESTGLMAVESYVLSGLFVWVPKKLFGRKRPDTWNVTGAFDFGGPGNGRSFPSGHTISAFSVATIFALQYKDTGWVPYAAYGLAGLAGISRIYDNRHWASDVFMGATLGIAIGTLVYKSHENDHITFSPCFQDGTLGGYLSFTF